MGWNYLLALNGGGERATVVEDGEPTPSPSLKGWVIGIMNHLADARRIVAILLLSCPFLKDAHKESFALSDARDEAIYGIIKTCQQRACNVPVRRYRDGENLSIVVVENPLDVFFVFASIKGAGGIDEYAAWLETVPNITNDGTLQLLTFEHIIYGPLADGFLIFAEHTLA
jgi:hypothetical protein